MRTPRIRLVLALLLIVSFCVFNFSVYIPLLARQVLGLGAEGFGFLMAAMGVGAVAGALALGTLVPGRPPLLVLFAAAMLACAGLLGLSMVRQFAVAVPVLFVVGFFGIIATAGSNTTLQLSAPDRLRGRVMSIYTLIFGGSFPIASFLIGLISERWSVSVAFLIAGVVGLCSLTAVIARWRVGRSGFVAVTTRVMPGMTSVSRMSSKPWPRRRWARKPGGRLSDVRIDEKRVDLPECRRRRSSAIVVDHEVVQHDHPPSAQRAEGPRDRPVDAGSADGAEKVGEKNDVLIAGPFRAQGVARQEAETLRHVRFANERLEGGLDTREIEDRGVERRKASAQGDAECAAASAHVEQAPAPPEVHETGEDCRRSERAGMLSATETPGLFGIVHEPIELGALAAQRLRQAPERRIDLAVDLKAIVVPEVPRRVTDKIGLARGGIGVDIATLDEQTEADTRGEEDGQAIGHQPRVAGQLIQRFRSSRQPAEDVEIERREEDLGRHESVRDP